MFSRILGTGSYVPEKTITNADLEKMVDTTDEWIVSRTGMKVRHIAEGSDATQKMALRAAKNALAAANIAPESLDMIIGATCTPDKVFPSMACYLQKDLGIVNHCPAFDITAACSGFIYALSIANQYIRSGAAKTILIAASESITRLVDWTDRSTCILFGDGAGAVILSASNRPGIYSTHLHASSEQSELLHCSHPIAVNKDKCKLHMNGNPIFKFAVKHLGGIVDETLQANNMQRSDIDWLIPHQANLRIIQAMAKKLDMPMDKVVTTIHEHANTSAASIPLALDVAIRDGRVQRGHTLLLEAFGGGLTWGSALLEY
ncbi:MAG: ketoacyl-ACP synthase III [Gammaproteobacteria bacterium]|nr:ketoacyl-ACP synthase III [Gammaproteobacteria bacterium]